MHPSPQTVLVVGFGAGRHRRLVRPAPQRRAHRDLRDRAADSREVVARYFSAENHDVLQDPRVEVIYDDARHYILTTREKFDVITSDPIHPWVKGAASLYTKEYFELVKAHLNPGGVITQWVPLYESTADVVKSEIATFFDVFPFGTVWSNEYVNGDGYDVVLLAKPEPLRSIRRRCRRGSTGRITRSIAAELNQVEFTGVPGLLATYGGQARDLAPWLAGAEINRDSDLRLQYLAGMGNNVYDSSIYQGMLAHRRFPDDLFTGVRRVEGAVAAGRGARARHESRCGRRP